MSLGRPFLLTVALALGAGGCLAPWDVSGPWKCGSGNTCPGSLKCDDAVCCDPDGTPACPTLPATNGTCPHGGQAAIYFQDADGDGEGNPKLATRRCRAPSGGGWVLTGTDCDDTDPAIHPGGAELCNGKDDNCNGVIDEGLTPQTRFYLDVDGDGWGADDPPTFACAAPPGHVAQGGDCAPFDATKFPGAPESCNGLDDNCNGLPDELETSFIDVDSPVHPFPCLTSAKGLCQAGVFVCKARPGGGVQRSCEPVAKPTREVCDGLDNNCDGLVDEAPACGGPGQLTAVPGATYFAGRLLSTSTLFTQCQKGVSSTPEVGGPGPTWSGGGAGYHLWYVEAPPGQVWDLSNPNAALRIAFSAVASSSAPDAGVRGYWGDPTPGQDGINPVVYLCGDDVTQVMRYRISSFLDGFKGYDTAFDSRLQLKAVGSPWLIGEGSGFDTTRVTRVELIVFSLATSFTLTLSPDAGFSR